MIHIFHLLFRNVGLLRESRVKNDYYLQKDEKQKKKKRIDEE